MTKSQKTKRSSTMRALSLTTASSLVLCMFAAQPVFAQTANGTETANANTEQKTEVVVVRGLRKALKNARDIKRSSDTFVDSITAQDIGALPDRSVAEALQRVPGINISRFEKRDDPDRFSVEGSGVIIRGLAFVRSELNGRDIFSANGGRELSFNDVSPELLGRVDVFKNTTADMIDGGISGTVNLVTRKPFDKPGPHLAGTIESNYGDMAKKWSPGFSVLGSNTYDTSIGTFGIQLGYANSELVTKTDASQITDPCFRDKSLNAGCIRVRPVSSGGFSGSGLDATTFPPANAVVVPKGAGVRTTDLTRNRDSISVVGQWKSNDKKALLTVEYLRANAESTLNEYAALALVNDDALYPELAPGTTANYANNQMVGGTLTHFIRNNKGEIIGQDGIPTELLRFQRHETSMTEDFSATFKYTPTDRLKLNFEAQKISSDKTETGFISAMQTYSDIKFDNSGKTPIIQFLQPGSSNSPSSYFNDPSKTFYWFLLDSQAHNEGSLKSLRFDGDYQISDDGFFKKARFGARWGDRNRVTRNSNYSNWNNLGAPWTGRGGNWSCSDPQAFGCGGAYVKDFPTTSQLRNPFGSNFQRGNAPVPFGNGSAFFFGGDNLVNDYLSGKIKKDAADITAYTLTPNAWYPISSRSNLVAGGPWTAGEISDVGETTKSAYARIDFGGDFDTGVKLTGNFGVRYVKTEISSDGSIQYPGTALFDAKRLDQQGNNIGGNGDGVVSVAEIQNSCSRIATGQPAPGYCSLSSARLSQFAAFFVDKKINDDSDVAFHNWLPSFNAKLDMGGGHIFRFAASKGIYRPDLSSYSTGGTIADNTNDLKAAGTLETGPLFQLSSGGRYLRPTESTNVDLSYEWYFSDVGSLAVSGFVKEITGVVNTGSSVRSFTNPNGAKVDVLVTGPTNSDKGFLRGVELSYQQTYDFLPGYLSGLGAQLTYTFVDAGSFDNSKLGAEQSLFAVDMPLAGVSKHTVNAVAFYEKGPISARLAYNWRSEFLQTPRDVIFPFSPIYGEATGQLDGSIFYSVNPKFKIGVQGVNLLDEVTRTSQVIDFKGSRITRSAFRNDRRLSVVARFDF